MNNLNKYFKKIFTGALMAALAVGYVIYLPTDVHADPTLVVPNASIAAPDRAKYCFQDKLNSYYTNHETFKTISCTHPSDPTTCDVSYQTMFDHLILGSPSNVGAFTEARSNACDVQTEKFNTLLDFILDVWRNPGSELLKTEDKGKILNHLTDAFTECIQNVGGCPVPDPVTPTVTGIPAPGSQSTDQATTHAPTTPATSDAPAAPAAINADQPSGGGCSIGVIETPSMGSLNYALFIALAGMARGIQLVRKYLKK